MDRMRDPELLFVIGHEMGHVIEDHARKKMMVAYAASALRKGAASQENMAGAIAASALGAFAQDLANAKFSRVEEERADDWGVAFLQDNHIPLDTAVETGARALENLGSSRSHSILASHPAPRLRAERLRAATDKTIERDNGAERPETGWRAALAGATDRARGLWDRLTGQTPKKKEDK